MGHPFSDVEKVVREAGLPDPSRKRLLELLENLQDVPRFMVVKLLTFLQEIKAGRFKFLSTAEKIALLENFHYIMRGEREGTVSEICHLFFEERRSSRLLPLAMGDVLVDLIISSRTDVVREVTWRILAAREPRLASLVSPQQLIPCVWAEDPIFRNNIVEFLFRHFPPGNISATLARYISGTGKVLPPEILSRVIAIGKATLDRENKKYLLVDLLAVADPGEEAMGKVWPKVLKGLTRFELIAVFQSLAHGTGWIEELRKGLQSAAGTAHQKRSPHPVCAFHRRIAGIRKNKKIFSRT